MRGKLLLLVVFVAAAAAMVANQLLTAWGPAEEYEVRTLVPTVASMAPGSSVRIAGVRVGRVTSIERKGKAAELVLAIDEDDAPLPRDSRLAVRLRSLVGETYVQIYPGRSPTMLPDGGVLPRTQVGEYVEAEKILDTLKGPTRERARQLIKGLARGVEGRGGKLNRMLDDTAGLAEPGTELWTQLAEDRLEIARLVDNLGVVTQTIGARGQSVVELAGGLRRTAQAIADRDDAVGAMLDQLPATLRQARTTAGTLRPVSHRAGPLLGDAAVLLRQLKPSLAALRPAAREGRAVVAELGRAAPPLQTTLRRLRTVSEPVARALPELRQTLCQANPLLRYLSPYHRELGALFANAASVTNFYDSTGHAMRLQVIASDDDIPPGVYDEATSKLVDGLLRIGPLGKLRGRGYNPYAEPGEGGRPAKGKGVLGPQDAKDVLEYTRVRPECGPGAR